MHIHDAITFYKFLDDFDGSIHICWITYAFISVLTCSFAASYHKHLNTCFYSYLRSEAVLSKSFTKTVAKRSYQCLTSCIGVRPLTCMSFACHQICICACIPDFSSIISTCFVYTRISFLYTFHLMSYAPLLVSPSLCRNTQVCRMLSLSNSGTPTQIMYKLVL